MMKRVKRIVITLVTLLVLLFLAFNIFIAYNYSSSISNLIPAKETQKNKYTYLTKHNFDYKTFEKQNDIQSFNIQSTFEDHQIPVAHINKKQSKGNVILLHGLGGTKETVYPIAEMFLKMGYTTFMYDQRNSGDNTAPSNTFGIKESKDLIDIVRYVNDKQKAEKTIIWGESFGGATTAFASPKLNDQIDTIILDSPMSNGKKMIDKNVAPISKETGMPLAYLNALGSIGFKVTQGIWFNDLDASQALKKSTTPILIMHSKTDKIIDYQDGVDLYQASRANKKELYEIKGSKHTEFIFDHPKTYQKVVTQFIEE
ncbi:alpha/beta hydrolase [Macrococcus animalis]|uniref:alpha/beta hydrolase n=1 Tax=Macrococcus animalis TaxID=3395467 RepID=UPI0039BE66E6